VRELIRRLVAMLVKRFRTAADEPDVTPP